METEEGWWDRLYREWLGELPDGTVRVRPDRGWITLGEAVVNVLDRFQQAKNRQEWRRVYEEYRASPEWRSRRERVMARCHGVCEGCGEQPASEVHHKTYRHVGDEFLDELVAYCGACHSRMHDHARNR